MRGGPSKAQNIIVSRPLSRRCADVSLPLPVRSRYATCFGPSTRSESMPFGDTLTAPSAASGAVATKNICCRSMNPRSSSVISVCIVAKDSPNLEYRAETWTVGTCRDLTCVAPGRRRSRAVRRFRTRGRQHKARSTTSRSGRNPQRPRATVLLLARRTATAALARGGARGDPALRQAGVLAEGELFHLPAQDAARLRVGRVQPVVVDHDRHVRLPELVPLGRHVLIDALTQLAGERRLLQPGQLPP